MKICKEKLPPVILLGGSQIALSVARALGKHNISCYAIDDDDSIVHHSKFCNGIKHLQDEEKDIWLEWLLEQGSRLHQKTVIIPCCDYALKIVIENRKALEEYYILPEGNDEVTLAMLDKLKTYQLAKSLNIPTPDVWNEVIELGLKFLQGIKFRGIGTLEFMRDTRDGKLKLLEYNPRFTGSTELLHKSGLNWALFVYNRIVGLPTPSMNYFKKGVYIIKPLSDYLAFRELKKNNKLSFFEWAKSLMHIPHFYLWSWSDPKPFIVNTYRFWKKQFLKIFRKLMLNNSNKYKLAENKPVL